MNIKKSVLGISLLLMTSLSIAATPAEVKGLLLKKYPKLTAIEVKETSIKGIFETKINNKIAYTDEKASYMLVGGELINLLTMENVSKKTEQVSQNNTVQDFFKKLPMKNSFKRVYGTGENVLYYFSDPDCPYCKQFENVLATEGSKLNVTVHTFLYPLESIHPDAARKSDLIWCANNPAKAWDDWMLNGKLPSKPEKSNCSSIVRENRIFGQTYGFTTTPTLVFANASMNAGVLSAGQLSQVFNYLKNNK